MKNYKTKIMGVLNANEDSFFKESRFDSKQAAIKIETMIQNGANVIDIGALILVQFQVDREVLLLMIIVNYSV